MDKVSPSDNTTHNDPISEFFLGKFPFNQEGLQEFSDAFVSRTFKKGALIAHKEDTESHLRFLEKGLVREFFSHEDKEMNTWFYLENEFITDFNLLLKGGQRTKFQECLEETTIKVMDRSTFFQYMDKYHCGRDFVQEVFKEIISLKEEEEFKHFSLTPDALYLNLLESRPKWLQRIPLYHIATFLRMTPETLSRIRKRN